jgi:hypothetical protein
MDTCDTILDGTQYIATCKDGITTIAKGNGDFLVSFKDPRALASSEGPLVMMVKLYLKGLVDGEARGRVLNTLG